MLLRGIIFPELLIGCFLRRISIWWADWNETALTSAMALYHDHLSVIVVDVGGNTSVAEIRLILASIAASHASVIVGIANEVPASAPSLREDDAGWRLVGFA